MLFKRTLEDNANASVNIPNTAISTFLTAKIKCVLFLLLVINETGGICVDQIMCNALFALKAK